MKIIPKAPIFSLIFELKHKHDKKLLCSILGVSISGYYKHRKLILSQNTKEEREKYNLEIIKNIALKYHRKYGYRMITMLLDNKYGIIMNHKKVHRIMKKYDLLAVIRKNDPYSKIRKATQEHKVAKNILERKFRGKTPFQKLGTDITYIKFQGKWIYLSIIKDMITGEILSHKLSENLSIEFVLETVKQLGKTSIKGALIHSDQGFHYTHPSFRKLLEKSGYIQSMSRKGNCIDNAPTESFFGHLKDEIDLSGCETFAEVEKYMKNYIYHYNNHRPQWNRKKMTPVQYRNHLIQK